MESRHSFRYFIAFAASISVWIAALLQALQAFDLTGSTRPDYSDGNMGSKLRSLDYTTLRDYWNWRDQQLGVDVTIDLLSSAGLLGLAYIVLILKRVFKRYKGGESDLPNFMTACFFIGAILPSIQFLQALGYTTSADWISQWSEIPPAGLQALYVAFSVQRGGGLYLFSMQFLFVPFGLACATYLTYKTQELPTKHAILGGITSGFGFLTFILELTAFNVTTMPVGIVFGFFVLIYGIILLPAWTIWLGIELKRLKSEQRIHKEDGFKLNEV